MPKKRVIFRIGNTLLKRYNKYNKYKTTKFINKAVSVHGNIYNYSMVDYIRSSQKVTIRCPAHGDFKQIPNSHLSGHGCPSCGSELVNISNKNKRSHRKTFVSRSIKVHGNRYGYCNVKYVNSYTRVEILCNKHGSFYPTPTAHISGSGCRKCANEGKSHPIATTEEYIKLVTSVHGEVYLYENTRYSRWRNSVSIVCRIHGEFTQRADHHASGSGCKRCRVSKGEDAIAKVLIKMAYCFVQEKRFDSCRSLRPLPFDFYIQSENLLIEYNGEQHYESIPYFGGENTLKSIQNRDIIKHEWAKANGYTLLIIKYTDFERIEEILLGSLKKPKL